MNRRACDKDFMSPLLQFTGYIFKEGVIVGDGGYDEEDSHGLIMIYNDTEDAWSPRMRECIFVEIRISLGTT